MKYLWLRWQCWLNGICYRHGVERGHIGGLCMLCEYEWADRQDKRKRDLVAKIRRSK